MARDAYFLNLLTFLLQPFRLKRTFINRYVETFYIPKTVIMRAYNVTSREVYEERGTVPSRPKRKQRLKKGGRGYFYRF